MVGNYRVSSLELSVKSLYSMAYIPRFRVKVLGFRVRV
jgi:hypothetical protein